MLYKTEGKLYSLDRRKPNAKKKPHGRHLLWYEAKRTNPQTLSLDDTNGHPGMFVVGEFDGSQSWASIHTSIKNLHDPGGRSTNPRHPKPNPGPPRLVYLKVATDKTNFEWAGNYGADVDHVTGILKFPSGDAPNMSWKSLSGGKRKLVASGEHKGFYLAAEDSPVDDGSDLVVDGETFEVRRFQSREAPSSHAIFICADPDTPETLGCLRVSLTPESGSRFLMSIAPKLQIATANLGEQKAKVELNGGRLFVAGQQLTEPLRVQFNPYSLDMGQEKGETRVWFGPGEQALQSHLRTTHGWPVSLKPDIAAGVALGWAHDKINTNDTQKIVSGKRSTFWCPDGRFRVQLPKEAGSGPHFLRLGAAATESLEIFPNDGVGFVRSDAYVALDQEGRIAHVEGVAWAPLVDIDPATDIDQAGYSIQPEATPLFVPPGEADLEPASLAFHRLEQPSTGRQFPMIVLESVPEDERPSALKLDERILAKARSEILVPKKPSRFAPANRSGSRWATTPQGFLVEVEESAPYRWLKISLGVTEGKSDLRVGFTVERPANVDVWPLEVALRRRDVLLVATRLPAARASETESLSFHIEDWSFDIEPSGKRAKHVPLNGVLVFKFRHGRISELLQNPENWTQPNDFNEDVSKTELRLQDLLKKIDESGDSTRNAQIMAGLRRRCRDPDWTGVMLFDVPVSPDGLPDDLKALRGGMAEDETDVLRALAVGVDANKIETISGQLQIRHTSTFGALVYESKPSAPESGFKFQIEYLGVSFEAAQVVDFHCKASLWTPYLFGHKNEKKSIDLSGTYERRDGGVYVLAAEVDVELKFTDSGRVFDKVIVSSLRLVSEKTENAENTAGRFLFDCRFDFADNLEQITCLKNLCLNGAAIVMTGESGTGSAWKFRFDPGAVTVGHTGEGKGGFLDAWPIRLANLHWSGFVGSPSWPRLELKSLDFVKLPIDRFNLGETFDFGLEFEIDLGELGGLATRGSKFLARLIVGWGDFTRDGAPALPVLGLRFSAGGGPLDIGMQNIFRISAKSVSAGAVGDQERYFAILLNNVQMEFLGYRLPDNEAKMSCGIFVPSQGGSPAFLWHITEGEFGPIKADKTFVTSGLKVLAPGESGTLEELVEKALGQLSADEVGNVDPDLIGPNAGWAFGFKGELKNGLGAGTLLMADTGVYGLRLKFPSAEPLFEGEVVYRRISDQLGVFSAQIAPRWRTLDFGGTSITLGTIDIDADTKGGFKVGLGFPRGNDFERSFWLTFGAFTGRGGVYIARRDSVLSDIRALSGHREGDLNKLGLETVVESGMAISVGLGRAVQAGPLSGIALVSIYGVLVGATATCSAFDHRRYIFLRGSVGVLVEIGGAVDFGIVKAAIGIRAWIEYGFTAESWKEIVVDATAAVSVSVSIVIASFRIFGRRFEIRFNAEFSWTYRATFKISGMLDEPSPLAVVGGIEPGPSPRHSVKWTHKHPVALDLVLAMDMSMEDGRPVFVPVLAAMSGLDDFAGRLLEWETTRKLEGQNVVTALNNIQGAMKSELPEIDEILKFLEENVKIHIRSPNDDEADSDPVPVPWLPCLSLQIAKDDENPKPVDFGDSYIDREWEENFSKRLFALRARDPEKAEEVKKTKGKSRKNTPRDEAFEDWIGMLIRTASKSAVDSPPRDFGVLVDEMVAAKGTSGLTAMGEVGALSARFLLGGLRAPAGEDALRDVMKAGPDTIGLAQRIEDLKAENTKLMLDVDTAAAWLEIDDAFEIKTTDADLASAVSIGNEITSTSIHIDDIEVPIQLENVREACIDPVFRKTLDDNPTEIQLWRIPSHISGRMTADVRVHVSHEKERNLDKIQESYMTATNACLCIEASIQLVPFKNESINKKGASTNRRLWTLRAADEDARSRLDVALKKGRIEEAYLEVVEGDKIGLLRGDRAWLLKTDMSTEARPRSVDTSDARAATHPVVASLKSPTNFATLLRDASIVNGDGFFVYLPDFESGENLASIDVKVVLRFGQFGSGPTKLDGANAIAILKQGGDARLPVAVAIELDEVKEVVNQMPAGHVVLEATVRIDKNQLRADEASRFHLLELSVPKDQSGIAALSADDMTPLSPQKDSTFGAEDKARDRSFHYRFVLPIANLALENRRGDELVGLEEFNPYALVGRKIEVDAGLRDFHGYRWPRVKRCSVVQAYTESLPNFSEWPGLAIAWTFSNNGARLHLKIHLEQASDKEEAPQVPTRQQKAFYRHVAFLLDAATDGQLHHDMSARFVAATGDRTVEIGEVDRETLRKAVVELAERVVEAEAGDELVASQILHIDIDLPKEFDRLAPHELSVRLSISRNEKFVDTRVPKRETGGSESPVRFVEAEARPAIVSVRGADEFETESDDAWWSAFAATLSRAFGHVDAGSRLMCLRGRRGQGKSSIAVIGKEVISGLKVKHQQGRLLNGYLPRPLSTQFESGEVIWETLNNEKRNIKVADVDIDALAEEVLANYEQALSPETFEKVLGPTKDAAERASVLKAIGEAVKQKAALAAGFANLAVGVDDEVKSVSDLEKVKERFRQTFSADLRSIYRAGVAVQVELEPQAANGPTSHRIRLYGPLSIKSDKKEGGLSPATCRADISGPSPLYVEAVFERARDGTKTALTEGQLEFRPTHIEVSVENSNGVRDFQASTWYEIISGEEVARRPATDLGLSDGVVVLTPIRNVPATPHILQTHALTLDEVEGAGKDGPFHIPNDVPRPGPQSRFSEHAKRARAWAFGVDASVPASSADEVEITFVYSGPSRGSDAASSVQAASQSSLLTCLFRLKAIWPDVTAGLQSDKVEQIVSAYTRLKKEAVQLAAALTDTMTNVKVTHNAQKDVFVLQHQGVGHLQVAPLERVSDRHLSSVVPLAGENQPRRAKGFAGEWRSESMVGEWDASDTPDEKRQVRRIMVYGLDVLSEISASASLQVFRNRTSPSDSSGNRYRFSSHFGYSTPRVSTPSSDGHSPIVDYCGATLSGDKDRAGQLAEMFEGLFDGAERRALSLDLQTSLAVPVFSSGPRRDALYPLPSLKGFNLESVSTSEDFATLFGKLVDGLELEHRPAAPPSVCDGIHASLDLAVYVVDREVPRRALSMRMLSVKSALNSLS